MSMDPAHLAIFEAAEALHDDEVDHLLTRLPDAAVALIAVAGTLLSSAGTAALRDRHLQAGLQPGVEEVLRELRALAPDRPVK